MQFTVHTFSLDTLTECIAKIEIKDPFHTSEHI